MSEQLAADRFHELLLQHSNEPDMVSRLGIEQTLWREFGAERAVLVLDMTGFSELCERHGIVHYLSMVRRMQATAEPIIGKYHGALVKFEADNCYATFPDVDGALRAALELNDAFHIANEATPDELDIRIACGIDFGQILVLHGRDFYGHAVNRACKLGEDVATAGEILITAEAAAKLSQPHNDAKRVQLGVSGIRIDAWSVMVT
ncbi:MAG: adenylate/guanylate cyclase domain-containing protein [Arenimonas sp.]